MDVLDLLKRHEGLRALPYCDRCGGGIVRRGFGWGCGCTTNQKMQGNITIGYGHNLSGAGISDTQALVLLTDDVSDCDRDVLRTSPRCSVVDARFAALVDARFNLGTIRFWEFTKMIVAIRAGNWDLAADELLDSAAADELPQRYKQLAAMLRTNKWPDGTT